MELTRGVVIALVICLGAALPTSVPAQTNNGPYPIGTRCGDLQEPGRSRCLEALDPRPNPQELLNRQHPDPVLPSRPKRPGDLRQPTQLEPLILLK